MIVYMYPICRHLSAREPRSIEIAYRVDIGYDAAIVDRHGADFVGVISENGPEADVPPYGHHLR